MQAITAIAYSASKFCERQITSLDELDAIIAEHEVTWLNVDDCTDVLTVNQLAKKFNLHPLAIEDSVNLVQRAKVDRYDDTLFIVLRMSTYFRQLKQTPRKSTPTPTGEAPSPATTTAIAEPSTDQADQLQLSGRLNKTEQISFFVRDKLIITFQSHIPGDSFDHVRSQLRLGFSFLRQGASDRLAYALIDAIIDGYFPVMERYSELIEDLESQVITQPNQRNIAKLHSIKNQLRSLRRTVWPIRDMLNMLIRDPLPVITESTRVYLRDCYDHILRILDLLETQREMVSDVTDLHLSSISNRMNEIMKVMTIVTTVFVPLNFVAGVYGMNFNTEKSPYNMPELNWYYGYPFVLTLMLVIAILLVYYFKYKRWIWSGENNWLPRERTKERIGDIHKSR